MVSRNLTLNYYNEECGMKSAILVKRVRMEEVVVPASNLEENYSAILIENMELWRCNRFYIPTRPGRCANAVSSVHVLLHL